MQFIGNFGTYACTLFLVGNWKWSIFDRYRLGLGSILIDPFTAKEDHTILLLSSETVEIAKSIQFAIPSIHRGRSSLSILLDLQWSCIPDSKFVISPFLFGARSIVLFRKLWSHVSMVSRRSSFQALEKGLKTKNHAWMVFCPTCEVHGMSYKQEGLKERLVTQVNPWWMLWPASFRVFGYDYFSGSCTSSL